jgi:peptidoglycan-N-acetylglucosamine deacetylase
LGTPFRVALTFDAEHPDRPHRPGATARVLATLSDTDVRGTFFLQGRWAEAYPALARSIPAAGHLVGNHSHYHARMPLLSPAGLAADVRAAERAIIRVTGVDPRPWFRCPFGSGTHDAAVLDGLAKLGYREVRWHAGGEDWHAKATGPSFAAGLIRGALDHGDGAVLLGHPWTTPTDRALPVVIAELREAGATFVRVDELDPVIDR